jgi:hypothetical protein
MMPHPPLAGFSFTPQLRPCIGGHEIWDELRKKFVLLTPEEWVRQHILHYLVNDLNYPAGLIAVEKEIAVLRTRKRFDVLVYNRQLHPWMLVECKSYDIKLSQETVNQAGRYNMALDAPYLAVTNGRSSLLAQLDKKTGTFSWLTAFPLFEA